MAELMDKENQGNAAVEAADTAPQKTAPAEVSMCHTMVPFCIHLCTAPACVYQHSGTRGSPACFQPVLLLLLLRAARRRGNTARWYELGSRTTGPHYSLGAR